MASLVHDNGPRNGAYLLITRDQGNTLETIPGPRVPDAAFDEHMTIERRDGSWQVFVRTKYGIGSSISRDRGRTLSEGKYTGIHHTNARFFTRRLCSGKLLLVRHDWPDTLASNQSRRTHLTAQLSSDDGVTWRGGLLLDDRQNVSYPDGFQAPDGSLTVVYDHERTKAMEVLFARVAEADIEADRCVSAGCDLRNIISAAGSK